MKMWIFRVAALAAAMCFGATTEDGVTKERRGALGPNDTVVTDVDTTGIVAARTYTKDEIDRRIATNAPVRSVNGRTGRVILGASDVGALPNNRDDLKASANFRNAVWDVQIRGGGIDTNTVDALANSAVVTNALIVATTNRVAAHVKNTDNPHSVTAAQVGAYTIEAVDIRLMQKADYVALEDHILDTHNPHSVTAAQVGAVPLVGDVNGKKTAVTIGSRNVVVGSNSLANGDGVEASGVYSHAEGSATTAAGVYSHAEGSATTAAGDYSHAEGVVTTAAGDYSHAEGAFAKTKEQDSYAFAWSGDSERDELDPYDRYESHGPGTFNINPVGGLNGFWIGEQTLAGILALKADKSSISATDPTFSNAVLAVGLNIDTNSVAVLNEIAATFGGFPIEGTATTVGGLLAALAAAVAWLKKNKVGSFKSVGGASATVENGVAKLDDFFGESNSLLAATIEARLPYPLYAVPSTGILKDRAINTTSLASVTVPDNFTDLLIRASVASSLSVTMPEAITKYGDTFPGEAGEYLITITKTGTAEAYVRTIKLEEVANA